MSRNDAHGKLDQDKPTVGRRRLLTGGGMVMAGVAGAGVAAAAAGPASAAAGGPVLQDMINSAGTSTTPTELDANNNTTPAFILANTGVDTTNKGAGPNLRLTPNSGATGHVPTASTAGGDLTATGDGFLWFTHNFGGTTGIVPAPVLTEATGNAYAQLAAPSRVLDTRTASGRANIANPTGNLDSAGRLKAGKTIAVNLDGLVFFADAVFANITVADMVGGGFLTVWSGAVARPTASTINFAANSLLANFLASGLSKFSATILNVVAIYASQTTHVILDVAGFTVPELGFAKFTPAIASSSRNARLELARQAMRAARQT